MVLMILVVLMVAVVVTSVDDSRGDGKGGTLWW